MLLDLNLKNLMLFSSDLHLDGTQHDPDVVGPQLDVDESNEALTTREYVLAQRLVSVSLSLSCVQIFTCEKLAL